ncbi:Hypothetical predicted protein, partial [Paramuricea clavata]
LDNVLKKMEKGMTRWPDDSPAFYEAKRSLEKQNRKEQLEKIRHMASERWFLLQ